MTSYLVSLDGVINLIALVVVVIVMRISYFETAIVCLQWLLILVMKITMTFMLRVSLDLIKGVGYLTEL
jgi:hypothetical protein